jgi:hypothetical protein
MASNISAIAPVLYSVAQEVSAEPLGAIDSINVSFDNKGVAKGDKVKVPYAPTQSNTAFTPAATNPEGTSVTAKAIDVEITKSQKNSMVLSGEQIRSLENGGNYQEWTRQWAAQAMRALRNEAEADLCLAIKGGASRAIGTAGTTPFATSLAELTAVRKILRDNGAPMVDLQFVMDTNAELNLLNLGIVQQAFAAGSDEERRQGRLLRQMGFRLQASAGIVQHVKGTATGFDIDCAPAASYAKGTYELNVDGGDNGTLKAGDILTLVGDTNKYVSTMAVASVLNTDTAIKIGRPGLRQTTLDGVEFTIGNDYTPCLAFERNSVVGIMRPPLIPANATIRQMVVSDGKGLSYLWVELQQYGQISWEMHLAWGFKVVQEEHVALVLG